MQPKEPPLATRLPPAVRERFDLYVTNSGLSRAAAAAVLVERGLDSTDGRFQAPGMSVVPVGGGRKIPVEGARREFTKQGSPIKVAEVIDRGPSLPANFTPNGAGVDVAAAMKNSGVQFGPSARAPRPKGGVVKKAGLLAKFRGEKS